MSFEAPISWVRTTTPLEKFDREWLYLRRFSSDHAMGTGTHAFANVCGGDPPGRAGLNLEQPGDLGVESTLLTFQDRRGAHALFQGLRRRLLEVEPATLGRLAGHMIYVWFTGEDLTPSSPTDGRTPKQSTISSRICRPTSPVPRNCSYRLDLRPIRPRHFRPPPVPPADGSTPFHSSVVSRTQCCSQ